MDISLRAKMYFTIVTILAVGLLLCLRKPGYSTNLTIR